MMPIPLRILWVGDDPAVINYGTQVPGRAGEYAVTAVKSATDAIRLLDADRFDIIIAGHLAEGLDGTRLLQEVRSRFGAIPFIVFTGTCTPDLIRQVQSAGADYLLRTGRDPASQYAILAHRIQCAIRCRAAEAYPAHGEGGTPVLQSPDGRTPAVAPRTEPKPFDRSRVENLTDYVVVYGQGGMILYTNPALIRALGYTAEQMTGTPLVAYVAEELRDTMSDSMAAREQKGEIPIYETEFVTRDGLRRSVIVKGTQVLFHNRPATLLLLMDITRRKALEDQLTARATELALISAAYQQVNRKLTLLSSITRHDINNQLTVIIGYLEILQRRRQEPSEQEFLQFMITAAQRIVAMIQFTREYEEIGILAPAWQDCCTLVDTAANQAPIGQIQVQNEIDGGCEVFADPLIVKVFYNLMDNAVRYGMKLTRIRFSVHPAGNDLILVCEDDGVGVIADEKERIFERDFGKNTGLGLFLSREILSITGITIIETGEPGTGARFVMTVPKGAWRYTSAGA
jgi:PAS domain S-box-containing protein